jgi:hypothetical protein
MLVLPKCVGETSRALNASQLSVPADYCASKAAVNTIHESLRYELDKKCASFAASDLADLRKKHI